jgi:hypothetical protein
MILWRRQIAPQPPPGELPYAHLVPLVAVLIRGGNELVWGNDGGWLSDRESFCCALRHKIDFNHLQSRFKIPSSIVLSPETQSILCTRSGARITWRPEMPNKTMEPTR